MTRGWLRAVLFGLALAAPFGVCGCDNRPIAPPTPREPADLEAFSKEIGVADIPLTSEPASSSPSSSPETPAAESTEPSATAPEAEGEATTTDEEG